MPTFRIVYIDDDTFAPRTLTAGFPDRAAAEIAMAKHGHRVVHIAALAAGEGAADPVRIAMAPGAHPPGTHPPEAPAAMPRRERVPPAPIPSSPRYDLAGAAVAVVGIAVVGAVFLLF